MSANAAPQARIDMAQVAQDHVAAYIAAIVSGDRTAMQREFECVSGLERLYRAAIRRGDAVRVATWRSPIPTTE